MMKKNLIKDYSPLSRNKKIALLKDQCWMYEKEYRIVFEPGESGFITDAGSNYLPVKIKRIYTGVRFTENDASDITNIMAACTANNVEVKTVEKSKTNYSMKIC